MSKAKSDATPLYEGMFLINPQATAGDLNAGLEFVRQALEKQNAEIVALHKWDERKLAFPIKGQKRGTYLLALFRMDGKNVTPLERTCELSDEVLRVLITRADHFGDVEIEQAVKDAQTTRDEAKLREGAESTESADSAEQPEQPEQAQPTASE
ncbi:MAG: 30S ribosomal protein S6 [Phycisphaeraceae bacterium]